MHQPPIGLVAGCLVALFVAISGCGEDSATDHSAAFVACLERHDGTIDAGARRLGRLPPAELEDGSGLRLDTLAYSVITMPADDGRRRAIVVVDPAGPPGNTPNPPLDRRIAEITNHPDRVRAIVFLRPARDEEAVILACEKRVAPGEIFP